MPFELYRSFDAAFRRKYGAMFEQYPFAAMAIEKEVRNFEAGDFEFMLDNCRKLAPRKRLKAGLLALAQSFGPAEGPGFYTKLSGFSDLAGGVAAELARRRGLRSFSAQKLLGFQRNKHLHGLTVRGSGFPRFMQAALDRGMDVAARDEGLLAALDRDVRSNLPAVRKLVAESRIQAFIADGDCMYFSRILVHVANELGIPYAVIAHGYVQNPYLVTIAPVYADMLVVWTEDQRITLSEAVGAAEARKIRYFGFPKPPTMSRDRVPGRVLVVWDPFTIKTAGVEEEVDAVARLTADLKAAGFEPRLRLHPKDRGNAALLQGFRSREVDLDEDSLGSALGEAALVIGSFSSVLVEAAAAGKPVLQIADYAPFGFEQIPQVRLDDPTLLARVRSAVGTSNPPYPPFDPVAFVDALDEVAAAKERRAA